MTLLRRGLLAIIVLAWVVQLFLDLFGSLIGGGLSVLGDIVLGGMQVYIAYRLACGTEARA